MSLQNNSKSDSKIEEKSIEIPKKNIYKPPETRHETIDKLKLIQ